MTKALTVCDFATASEWLARHRRPLLITHTKPDGDAIGALVAMRLVLRTRHIEGVSVVFDRLPDRYTFLESTVPLPVLNSDIGLADLTGVDSVIVCDTCSFTQLEPIADWLRHAGLPTLVLDHHVTRDDVADIHLIDETAAATCIILHDWAVSDGWQIDPEIATALYVGIATDTGWFRHSNTDQRVFAAAGELVGRGACPHELYEKLFQRESVARFRLRAAADQRVELLADDRLAVIVLTPTVFAETGARLSDTEDLVNGPLQIGSVVVSVMLVPQDGGVVRIGLRSRAPLDDRSPDVDVAAVARAMGGGGHRRAAGARMIGNLAEVRTTVVTRIENLLS